MRDKYDIIIIGSGIGGLVCGNYLSKSGKKVLIIEKNNFPGGNCSSYTKNGLFFDSCPTLINELGENGYFSDILRELKIYNEKDYMRFSPLAIFYMGDKKYVLSADYREVLDYFKDKFPEERLDEFFSLLDKGHIYLYKKLKDIRFLELLDKYFIGLEIKNILYSLVSFLGTPPERISALYAMKFIKSILEGGAYYPKGGMQSLSERLTGKLYDFGAEIIFNKPVEKILAKNGKVYGVADMNNNEFYADTVISNISPIITYDMLSKNERGSYLLKKKKSVGELSESAFILHVALKSKADIFLNKSVYFIISNSTIRNLEKFKKLYSLKSPLYKPMGFILVNYNVLQPSPNPTQNNSLTLEAPMFYRPKRFWDMYKEKFAQRMLDDIEYHIPGFEDNVAFENITTPATIEYYTGNNNGAVGGWSMVPRQVSYYERSLYQAPIKNLFFTGHWTYPGVGVSSTAISGKNVAKLILGL